MEYKTFFSCQEGVAEVQTTAGRLRGLVDRDVYTFKGIRYATAKRFMPPEPVEPWEGTRLAFEYSFVCPPAKAFVPDNGIKWPHRAWATSEDCLNLNVWTRSLDPNAKKPVLVWLHGGGYFDGSAIDQIIYDGDNQARFGDVVAVSINHRLHALGFLDLSAYGEKYQASGNVGIIDLVAALRWVHDNIAQFGGDPGNVTIYGQSGGGGKVTTLMQMPSADGLYHRAIIESGLINLTGEPNTAMRITKEDALEDARKMVECAGGLEALETMPVQELIDMIPKAVGQINLWAPVPGAGDYPGDMGQAGMRPETKHIPVMIGSSICEFSRGLNNADKSKLTAEEKMAMMRKQYGDQAETVLAAFRESYPELNDVYAVPIVPMGFRPDVVEFCRRWSAMGGTVYQYVNTYESAIHGGMPSWHGMELPFVFHKAELVGSVYNGEQTWITQEEIFNAWISFARSGNPNHDKLPQWRPYTADDHACMVFGAPSTCRVDHDAKLIALPQNVVAPRRIK